MRAKRGLCLRCACVASDVRIGRGHLQIFHASFSAETVELDGESCSCFHTATGLVFACSRSHPGHKDGCMSTRLLDRRTALLLLTALCSPLPLGFCHRLLSSLVLG